MGKVSILAIVLLSLTLFNVVVAINKQQVSQDYVDSSEGEKMERQLRYANFTLATEFQESYALSYSIDDEDKEIFYNMKIELYEAKDYKEIYEKRFLELQQSNEYVEEKRKKSFVINKKRFNVRKIVHKKYQEEEDEFRQYIEYVFIELADKIIVFSCYGFDDFYNNGVILWEEMYKSFTEDYSKAYKLPFGSFTPPKGLRDISGYVYKVPGVEGYSIEIEYINDVDDAREYVKNLLDFRYKDYPEITVKVNKDKRMSIDGQKSRYLEFRFHSDKEENIRVFALCQIIDTVQPGLEITISADSLELFELYRPKMNDFLNSIRFDK